MRVTNEQFAQALQRLYDSEKVRDQKELASVTGITETTISRILNDKVKRPSEETIRKLLKVFPNVFSFEEPKNEFHLDNSSLFNATIAAKDETIISLKREVQTKSELVLSLQNQLAAQNDHIETLKARITDLQATISSLRSSDRSAYPFPVGTAEDKQKRTKV